MSGSAYRFRCPLHECNNEQGPLVFDAETAQQGFIKHLAAPTHPDGRSQVALDGYLREHHDWLHSFKLEIDAAPTD